MSEDRAEMSNLPAIHISCLHCGFSNEVTVPTLDYTEAVYQPCSNSDGNSSHNKKAQVKCVSCRNDYDFYWCVGHTLNGNEIR